MGTALATALRSLTFLDLSGNKFGEAGLRALARGMQVHAGIRCLKLADCGLATVEKKVQCSGAQG
jgi:Ran GTPase-activating protein (RanGAP) involved in mRNA processing and transport